MLAPACQLSARDQIAPAYQLSALDHSQVIGDQTFYFFSERLSETLFIGQPLQQKGHRRIAEHSAMTISTAASGPGRARGTSCDEPPTKLKVRVGGPGQSGTSTLSPDRRAGLHRFREDPIRPCSLQAIHRTESFTPARRDRERPAG